MQFRNVVAQAGAKATFLASVAGGRLSHAQLFKGVAGVGKLPFALAAAQYLLCQRPTPDDSCGVCAACMQVSQGLHPDLHFVLPMILQAKPTSGDDLLPEFRQAVLAEPYIDLAAWGERLSSENKQLLIPIQEVRALQRKLQLKAFAGGRKVVVIWHIEKMNPEAANALLKLLEEPAEDTILLITAEDPATLLPTLTSRCQLTRLPILPRQAIADYLVAHHHIPQEQAEQVAAVAGGSLSAALAALENTTAPLAEQFQAWLRLCYEGRIQTLTAFGDQLGREPKEHQKLFLAYGLEKLRSALCIRLGVPGVAGIPAAELNFLTRLSTTLDVERLGELAERFELTLYHISRNASVSMQMMSLSLALHNAFRATRAAQAA